MSKKLDRRNFLLRSAVAAGTAALPLRASIARSEEPVRIGVSWVAPVADWASILFEKKGLAQHLDRSYIFEPIHFNGTPSMITAMATNDLQIGQLAFSSIGLAIENAGMTDLRIITAGFEDGAPGYYTNEYFVLKDSPIESVSDLKGKVLATVATGSAVDIAMRAMLRQHHIDDRKDVTVVETAFPNMLAMLKEHKVDIFPGVLPFSADPAVRQATRTLFTQKEAIGTTQMTIFAVRDGFIQKHRAALVDFLEDTLRAERWFLDPANHQEVIKIASRVSKLPESEFESWLFTKSDYYRSALPNLDALQASVQLQNQLGFLKSDIDIRKYVDLSLVQEATKRLS